MSEKRFTVISEKIGRFHNIFVQTDKIEYLLTGDFDNDSEMIKEIVDLLNEQQKEINELNQENADLLRDKIKSLDEFEKCTNKLKKKILEQQANINELQSIIKHIKCEENCFDYDYCCETVCSLSNEIKHLKGENEQLRMKLKGDDYIMVSEMLSNLRKTGICDGCKNKDKPVEWYLERGFSITGRVCDRYEPEV